MHTLISRHRHKQRNDRRHDQGHGSLEAKSSRRRGPAPTQSVHLQSRGASRSHSRAHAGCLLGARPRHTSRVYVPGGGLGALCPRACALTSTRRMGGGALPSSALSLSTPRSGAPWGCWAHGQQQDGRGTLAMSCVLSSSVKAPWGSDPRSPPPPSGSSLRRPLGRCGCPERLQPVCRWSHTLGSRLGWQARCPGSGGPPPASPGSG